MQVRVLPEVRPVSDLRQNMSEIMEAIDKEKRPVILTKHGSGKYVLITLEQYEDLINGKI